MAVRCLVVEVRSGQAGIIHRGRAGKSGVKTVAEIVRALRTKPVEDVARMFLMARNGLALADARVRAGRADTFSPVGREYTAGVRDALAWVLEVDLRQMDEPKPEALTPREVTVSWVDAYGCWFVEFPPDEMQAQQQYRAEFLSMKQARALCDELWECLRARAYLGGVEFSEWAGEHAARRRRALSAMVAPAPVRLGLARAARASASSSSSSSSPGSSGDGDGDLPQGA